ncbi:hypothetical protein P4N68_01465 [Corynebacterium felinum]|uniref:Uncharacterized protein n=1 Tax=Corynebacterium felinum TaxID=131318 RepID=A0ABU2B9E5_9CORY|nr:hypothetical protein [Corynebacterium felinum]MDF5819748.1 hypothetical protein [Corynebacterium felinum]MDR7354388.1 hypothetical protein [Corynebacterium felinum]WJY93759.1 hypothetical protein CFELI_00510 [Corynebacterium felinum]
MDERANVTAYYEDWFYHRLQRFVEETLPTTTALVHSKNLHATFDAHTDFPRTLVETIRDDEKLTRKEKVEVITAVIGQWMNATTGSVWSIGPCASDSLTERIGIGVKSTDGTSFFPLVPTVEDIVDQGAADSSRLDLTIALCESDRRHAKPSPNTH